MKYQLIKEIDNKLNATQQILVNRGIDINDIEHYLNTTDDDINDPELFGKEEMKMAAITLLKTIYANEYAIIIVDCDCDGYTSSAILINYLYKIFPTWVENNLTWYIHENKEHGLSDCFDKIKYSQNQLIIIPDAGSNDYEYHKKLKNEGRDIIILDHHEASFVSEDAIIINNQLSNYPNKDLSGAGVTWQFCRYLDKIGNTNFAEDLIDLVALGNMADMMSLKSLETKHLINKGFQAIKNPFIYTMADKNSYSLKGKVTPMGAAFYIAPFVNSMVRSGTLEEKELLFKSMLQHKAFEQILSNKRGHAFGETERLVDQAVRTATNVKNRQTRVQDSFMELLEKKIIENNMMNNKILLFLLEPQQIDKNIAGLCANKIMAKYQKPTCILTKTKLKQLDNIYIDNINEKVYTNYYSYEGSARGCDKTGINNFKDICAETGCIMYAEGHQGAFGLGISEEKISKFLEQIDILLEKNSTEPIYFVDYIYDGVNIDAQSILDISALENLWGKDIDEPFIAIKNLKVTKDMVTLMSPDKKPTLKISLPNKISIIKFNSSEDEYNKFLTDGCVIVDIVGKCNANTWNGWTTAQILIEDYQIVGQNKYCF